MGGMPLKAILVKLQTLPVLFAAATRYTTSAVTFSCAATGPKQWGQITIYRKALKACAKGSFPLSKQLVLHTLSQLTQPPNRFSGAHSPGERGKRTAEHRMEFTQKCKDGRGKLPVRSSMVCQVQPRTC